jgi:hypothetical protein
MSPNNDVRRMKSSRRFREPLDLPASASLARTLQAASVRMRRPVILPVAVTSAILGAALLLNGVLAGAALFATLPLLLLGRKGRDEGPADRSAVRLALRLAKLGQRTLLVESGARMRVVTLQEAAQGPQLQYLGARANGALILARRRT